MESASSLKKVVGPPNFGRRWSERLVQHEKRAGKGPKRGGWKRVPIDGPKLGFVSPSQWGVRKEQSAFLFSFLFSCMMASTVRVKPQI